MANKRSSSSISSLQISLAIHGFFVLCYLLLRMNLAVHLITEKIPIEVIYPKAVPTQLKLQAPKNIRDEKITEPLQKKVFGVSRKSLTTALPNETTAEVKQGNTIAKEMDNLKLEKEDPESLPIPTDDYLVTTQAALLKDIKIPYPAEAKRANVEGPVVMDLVIDALGNVRAVELIRGPGSGLNEAAIDAVKAFLFRPAKVGDRAVAIKIRYTYRFVLENR